MKRFLRGIVLVLALLGLSWTFRSFYLYRIWTMAHFWYDAVPTPSVTECFSPRMRATSKHGVLADIAFLRVPLSSEEAEKESRTIELMNRNLLVRDHPNRNKQVDKSCPARWLNNDPFVLPVPIWQDCYGVSFWFAVNPSTLSHQIRQIAFKGGVVAIDRERNVLYVAAYRKH